LIKYFELDLSLDCGGEVVVVLEERLQTIVGKRLLIGLSIIVENLGQGWISNDLTLISRILQLVILNILAEILCNLDTRMELISGKTSKLGHLRADQNRLEETRVIILASRRLLLLHNTSRGCMKSLDTTSDSAQELDSGILVGAITKTSNLRINETKELCKISHNRLAGGNNTSLGSNFLLLDLCYGSRSGDNGSRSGDNGSSIRLLGTGLLNGLSSNWGRSWGSDSSSCGSSSCISRLLA
jgi:hypothetical protein